MYGFIKCLLITAAVVSLPALLLAGGPGPPPAPGSAPLDPVSWVLLAGAGGMAVRRYYQTKSAKNP